MDQDARRSTERGSSTEENEPVATMTGNSHMEVPSMAVKPSIACALQKCLGKQWMENSYSDFTVVVEDSSFQCHKFILSACSGYFQGLFRSNMKECQENRVELGRMTSDTFALILDIVYKGIDILTEENVLKVWAVAVQLQMEFVALECETFVASKMSTENCFIFYDHVKLYSSVVALRSFLNCMHTNFESVKKSDGFFKLPICDLYQVISSNNLSASSEDSVVDAILEWMDYIPQDDTAPAETQAENRKHIAKLLSAVRLCLVSSACLRKLSKHDLVLSCRESLNLIFEAIHYNMCVEHRHDAWPEAAVHRATSSMKHVMVFVDGDKLKAYILNTGVLQECATLPKSKLASITVFDNMLYLFDSSTLGMRNYEKQWKDVISTPKELEPFDKRNILLSHGRYIYCYKHGNLRNSNSLVMFVHPIGYAHFMKYNCTHGHETKWEKCSEESLNADSFVRFKQYILMFVSVQNVVTTKCFDTNTGSFIQISPENPITAPSDNMVSFTDQNDVFILQGNGKLWKIISTDTSLINFEHVSKLWNFSFKICGAVVYQKQLFVFFTSRRRKES